jgi:hypothetical protein
MEVSMADDQRLYSDEEFALILRKAAELASRAESPAASSAGLTLAEMKSAASQAGLDAALIEQAARMLAATATATAAASRLERLIGGPLRHDHQARFRVRLDESSAALLLSAVRIAASVAGSRDVGHSSSLGMTWHDGGELESLGVTARPEEDGASVSVTVDRRGTLVIVGLTSALVAFFAVLFSGSVLYPDSPALGYAGCIAGIGAALAVARNYWASSTRKVRERISVVMDAIARTLSRPETQVSGLRAVGDGAAAASPATMGHHAAITSSSNAESTVRAPKE